MADATWTMAIDNTQFYPIVTKNACRRVTCSEQFSSSTPPTTDLYKKQPSGATNYVLILKGTPAIYTSSGLGTTGGFADIIPAGVTVGSIETASGSIAQSLLEMS